MFVYEKRPDLVIEILSPSTRRHDRLIKLGLYQRAGVREYWIVDPENKAVQVFLQDGGGWLNDPWPWEVTEGGKQ